MNLFTTSNNEFVNDIQRHLLSKGQLKVFPLVCAY